MVESRSEWNARVVYGDTDSLFVCLPGASKERAFEVGQQIAETITKHNPSPVTLRLEKVYKPCILAAKKRYVGYKWETIDQKAPILEAKGIELVRRDTCPAVVKILEKSLR
jgi:DNA polymerase zeta